MKKYYFLIFGILLIILLPWLWKLTRLSFNFGGYIYLLTLLFGLILGLLFLKFEGKKWQLFLCALIIPFIATEIMWFVSYQIHYAANDIHAEATKFYRKEMYRDFSSYFDFSYGNNNWKFRLTNILYEIAILTGVSIIFLAFRKKMHSTNKMKINQ